MDLRNWRHFFKVLVSGYFLVYELDSVFPSHVNPLAMICVTCVVSNQWQREQSYDKRRPV